MAKKIKPEEIVDSPEEAIGEPEIVRDANGTPEIDEDAAQKIINDLNAKKAQEASQQQAANEAFRKTQQPEPIKIVELDDVIQSQTLSPEQQKDGVKFFFGEIGVLTFPDKSTYHVRSHTAFITDPLVIHNIKTFAESNPGQKIFIQ